MTNVIKGLLLSTLLVVGCANEEPSREDDGSTEAWAAVEAGTCTPDCTGRTCGLDPICGVSCGSCSTNETCDTEVGQCEAACVPDCTGRTCGLDPICGVSCGSCGANEACDAEIGQCEAVCVPDCSGRTCGVDPVCGVSCGTCGTDEVCSDAGICQDKPKPRHCPGGGGGHGGGHHGGGRHGHRPPFGF